VKMSIRGGYGGWHSSVSPGRGSVGVIDRVRDYEDGSKDVLCGVCVLEYMRGTANSDTVTVGLFSDVCKSVRTTWPCV
jgi:hypothetical protein